MSVRPDRELRVLSLTQLEVLLGVVDAGGFSGAARRLYMSQPSISNHVRNLENSLGVQLVERTPQGAKPTPAGEQIVDHARQLFEVLNRLERSAADFQGLDAGRMVVAGTTTLGSYLLPRLVAEFARQAPRVSCQIRVGNEDTVETWLLQGEVPLGLCVDRPRAEQLTVEPMFDEEMILVSSAESALAGRSLTTDDLLGERFLMRETGSATRRQQEAALRAWGLTSVQRWELWGTDTLKESMHAGLGVALISEHAVRRELEAGLLAQLALRPAAPGRTVSLVRRADRVLTPPEELFVAQLRAVGSWPS
ncbi:MAG TPA: LysR family transcriptional regulator [Microlunatus sp.]